MLNITPERVKSIRVRMGLTQVEFAARCRKHPLTISRWERGIYKVQALEADMLLRLEIEAGPVQGQTRRRASGRKR